MHRSRRFRRATIVALAAASASLPTADASARRHATHRSRGSSNRSARSCARTRGSRHRRARNGCRRSAHSAVLSAAYASTGSEATFGNTSVGASSDSFLEGRKRVNRYALPTSGAVSRLEIYLAPTSNAGQQVLRGVIYADSSGKPQALLAVSEQLTFNSSSPAGWYALPFAASVALGAGNYWIGVITGASSHVAGFRYAAVSGARLYNANAYGPGPSNPFGSATGDSEQMSLYATYTASAPAPPVPAQPVAPPPAEQPPAKTEPAPPPKEEPRNSGTLGRVRVAPDTVGWGGFLAPSFTAWGQEHLAYLRLYYGAQESALSWGLPDEAYRDWPAGWEGTYAPMDSERSSAFISQKSAADKAAGFGGEFIDDVNWTGNYRDNLQAKQAEPEQAELGHFLSALRAFWGPSAILDCNTQLGDALAVLHTVPFEEDLNACNVQTREFGVSQITSASGWAGFLTWADDVHAHHDQVRITGSMPVSEPSFELETATYLLITENVSGLHGDLLWLSKQLPAATCSTTVSEGSWWCGLNLNLGEAIAGRELTAQGVYVRRYSGGEAVVNPPGNSAQAIALPRAMRTVTGTTLTSVTLGPDQGAVLVG
jgi:hypothetical protein